MGSRSRLMASAAVGSLALLCVPALARGQVVQPVARLAALPASATLPAGSLAGVVQDEKGAPVARAMVSAFGASTVFAVTDDSGRFEFRTLSPGSYLLRAHLSGFVASPAQLLDVSAGARVVSSIALRRVHPAPPPAATTATKTSAATAGNPFPIAEASVGTAATVTPAAAQPADTPAASTDPTASDDADRSETAWRINHARRGVLRDATVPEAVLAREEPSENVFGRTVGSSARLTNSFFSGSPLSELSGQFNLLTTGSFDNPQQFFTDDSFSRSIAYVSVGAPAGSHADWSMRGALTEGDLSSWIVAAAYATHGLERNRYDVGFNYGTQRYDGGNPAALRDLTDGSRNVGEVHGSDTFTIVPAMTLTSGGSLARYDYLTGGPLLSPRIALTVTPVERLRFNGAVERRAIAPGAEEFLPPTDGPLWLPPQRTFSSIVDGRPMQAERTDNMEFGVERDLAASTLSFRVFRQHVADQLVTLFGVDMPDAPSEHLGHYFVGNVGDVDAAGWSAAVRLAAGHLHGSVEYSQVDGHWNTDGDRAYLVFLTPSAARPANERIYNVATSIETVLPETATRVIVLCRMGNGFASSGSERPGFDSRFDVQVRQSLPFMDFSNTRWEMLVAVRNFYRDATATNSSVYDELTVVRPPKRIVGGLALRF